jgi:hypothetical protein
MRAMFLGLGPTIPPGTTIDAVENVDVYPFMIELLGLRMPGGVDGRPEAIRSMVLKRAQLVQ